MTKEPTDRDPAIQPPEELAHSALGIACIVIVVAVVVGIFVLAVVIRPGT